MLSSLLIPANARSTVNKEGGYFGPAEIKTGTAPFRKERIKELRHGEDNAFVVFVVAAAAVVDVDVANKIRIKPVRTVGLKLNWSKR